MVTKIVKSIALISALILSSAASATVLYEYNRGAGVFGGNSGLSYDSVYASYDTGTQDFEFTVDYAGTASAGGWLVISPGANPKGVTDELGIAYLDATSNSAWIYAYNGANSSNSYQTTDFLGYFANAYTTTNGVATLSFNAAAINAMLETGFAFGNRIGIWFHPTANLTVLGGANGLDQFSASGNGWLDTNYDGDCNNPNNGCITTSVPEPGTLALWGFGLIGLAMGRKKALTQKS